MDSKTDYLDKDIAKVKELMNSTTSELAKAYGKVLLSCMLELRELSK